MNWRVLGLFILMSGSTSALAIDSSCNDLLSGLSNEARELIFDLARLRHDLDQRLARGERTWVIRELQSQYVKKESEILALTQLDRAVLIRKIQAEIDSIQGKTRAEKAARSTEWEDVLDSVARVSEFGVLDQPSVYHEQSTLLDGRVLVVGGYAGWEALDTITVIDPKTGKIEVLGKLKEARQRFTQSVVSSDWILVSGGSQGKTLNSIERIDLKTGMSKVIGHLQEARYGHTQSFLSNDQVVVVGGFGQSKLASIELIDVKTGNSSIVGYLKEARDEHQQSVLLDGRILVSGGSSRKDRLTSLEVIDLKKGDSQLVGFLSEKKQSYTQSVLPDGRVLIAGGYSAGSVFSNSIEIFDPVTNELKLIGQLEEARYGHTQSVLPDGRVLITGGYGQAIGKGKRVRSKVLTSIERIDLSTGKSEVIGHLKAGRADHTQSVLLDGRVTVFGGQGETGRLNSIEMIEANRKNQNN